MKETGVTKEIKAVLQERIESQEPTPASWLTTIVVEAHPNLKGADANWYRVCAYGYVRDAVRKLVNASKAISGKEPDQQMLLPGFNRLQKLYAVERQGKPVFVPIDQMSDDEIKEKIREYTAMAVGCEEHVKELKRYLRERHRKMNAAVRLAASQKQVA